jgi:hypothetical protein
MHFVRKFSLYVSTPADSRRLYMAKAGFETEGKVKAIRQIENGKKVKYFRNWVSSMLRSRRFGKWNQNY